MPKGGYRPGAGRPKGSKDSVKRVVRAPAESVPDTGDEPELAPGPPQTPVEYMLSVMNDPKADPARRDRMAIAIAGLTGSRDADKGKKEQRVDAAKEAAETTKFATPGPPKLVVSNA